MGDTDTMSTTGTEAKLLVVDDEPNIRDLLASSLRFAGFDVVTAETEAAHSTKPKPRAPT